MGAKSSKKAKISPPADRYYTKVDIESGPAVVAKSQDFILEVPVIPETCEESIPDSRISRDVSEVSRVSSGSEVDVTGSGVDDEHLDIQSSDDSVESIFDPLLYLANQGIDVTHSNIRELVCSENYREFLKQRKTMLTPKELFELEHGRIPGNYGKSKPKEEILKEIDELECKADDLLTDLSDDENGWPKYDMNALLEKYENHKDSEPNLLIPTKEDYERDKKTCCQQVLNSYEFDMVESSINGHGLEFECLGPDATRTQDFWTQCHKDRISLITMFGKFLEKRGANCKQYIPDDKQEILKCGQIIVRRLTDPEYPYRHCKIQKFAVRCKLVPENYGWYVVWHCQRDIQEYPSKDYTKEDEEFENLRKDLLNDMPTQHWLFHGPMQFSPLRDRLVERNSYLIEKKGSSVPDFVTQPIQAANARKALYEKSCYLGFLTSSSSQISLSGCQSRQIGGADEVENLVKLETEEFDLQKSLGSYPIQSQNRLNNVIQIYANSPDPEQTQDFWQMILHKGIPTIHTISDLDPEETANCASYFPYGSESEKSCGIYTVKRLGIETQLSMNLKKQQLLIFKMGESEYQNVVNVTHFHEIVKNQVTDSKVRNIEIINEHVSRQSNPQLLIHGP